jgi:acyl-CoA thioester hydrolase
VAPDLISGFPVTIEIPVLWSDEDSFAHVNNLAYLRWCEESRVQYLHRIALLPSQAPPRGVGPIVLNVACRYRLPLNYPDTVVIGTRVVRVGNTSFRMEHRIVSRAAGKVAAEAETTIVTIDYGTGASVRVPDSIRENIARLDPSAVSTGNETSFSLPAARNL